MSIVVDTYFLVVVPGLK